tara:strand:- start:299 stop:928 length:630 start_codon:yes stop_codon:yes gene_type:complete
MKQSDSITDLATALCLAQSEMGGAIKDSNNPFFKSSYADLTSVIKVIKQPFANHGLSFVQLPITSEGGRGVGVVTMLMHSSGQWIQSEYLLPMDKVTPQGAGSAITYARRYALQSLCGIPAVDDDSEMAMYRNDPVPLTSVKLEVIEPAKRVSKKLVQEVVSLVLSSQASNETSVLIEALSELEEHEKQVIWKQLTGEQQDFVRLTKEM